MKNDVEYIVKKSIEAVLPEAAVERALEDMPAPEGRLIMVAIGKAAYRMGKCACEKLKGRSDGGIIITKYGHSEGDIPGVEIYEAGHPVPDENTYKATERALEMVSGLSKEDCVLFLISGGGSALFEKPLVEPEELERITEALLKSGASIQEINVIRKRLSAVKGGKFALKCAPARVYSVLLSDVLGDLPDTIASGPAYPDSSTVEEACEIVRKYGLRLSEAAKKLIMTEPVKEINNVTTVITGSVKDLCKAAAEAARSLCYDTEILTDSCVAEARAEGAELAGLARAYAGKGRRAFIAGGETVVHVKGTGLGGRNQELALAAAKGIAGLKGVTVFSLGSDGTDGPTDAAGGVADGDTVEKLKEAGISIDAALENNDAYHALKAVDGLIMTGPTGTNVNDVSVLLIEE